MNMLKKAWDHLEEVLLVPSFMFSVALIFLQVIMRVAENSLTWSEELARYLYIWQTWLGVSYAARNGTHLRITMVKDRLSPKGQMVLEVFVVAIWVAFAIFVAIQGLAVIETISAFGQKSSALQIPMQICYYAIPTGMVLMCIRLVERLVKQLRDFGKAGKEELL